MNANHRSEIAVGSAGCRQIVDDPQNRHGNLHQAILLTLCLFSGGIFLSGCALNRESVGLAYVAQKDVTRIDGANTVGVKVDVTDVRLKKDRISCKKNGYGMEMANFEAKEDVTKTVSQAIESELANRGFSAIGSQALVLVELSKFYCDFKVGVFAGDAVGEVAMNVQVKNKNGHILFSKVVTGENTKGAGIAAAGNVKVVLEAALAMAVGNLMSDKTFIDSLFKACRNS